MTRTSAARRLLPILLLLVASTAHAQAISVQHEVSRAALEADGPYDVRTYTDFPAVPEFSAATIYYPADASGPVGGVAISPGFTQAQEHNDWWGPRLASHGYAVLILDTNTPTDNPELRGEALIAGVRVLRAESTRAGSPLHGLIDPDRMAVMGHSMGGGGALHAAQKYGDELKAAIPYTCWERDAEFPGIAIPTLFIAGSADRVAPVAQHARPHYEQIAGSTPKVYLELDGGDHYIANTGRGTELDMIGRYAIAWLRLYVDEDERFHSFIYGEEQRADSDKLSAYMTNP